MKRIVSLLSFLALIESGSLIGAGLASAEQYSGGGITVTLNTSNQSFNAAAGCANATTMALQAPARFVIDCPRGNGLRKKSTAEYSLPTSLHPIVEGIRFGAHADKVRIVFDLRTATPATFTTKGNAGFALTFRSATAAAGKPIQKVAPAKIVTPKADLDQVSIQPVGTPQLIETPPDTAESVPSEPPLPVSKGSKKAVVAAPATPAPTTAATQQLIEDFDLGVTDTTPSTEKETPQPTANAPESDERASIDPVTLPEVSAGPRRLANLVFDYLPPAGEPVLRLILSKPGEFKLLRKGDQGAVITISGCSLAGNHLTLPHFPPEDFAGFTVVEVSEEANSCVVKVGTERNIRLSPYTKDNEIQVRRAAG